MGKATIYSIILYSCLALYAPRTGAQVVSGQRAFTSFGTYFQSWKLNESTRTVKLDQWALPINCFIPLGDNYELRILASAASTDLNGLGEKNNLIGLNDTKIEVAGSFLDDRFLISMGANIPSGTKSLKTEEMKVAQYLCLDYLNLPVKSFGEGLNLNLTTASAIHWKDLVFGIGVGYQYNGTYQPYDNFSEYKPGDRIHLTFGVSSYLDEIKLTGDLTYFIYQADKQSGNKIFKDGNELDIKGSFLYNDKRFSAAVNTRFIIRASDKRYGVSEFNPEDFKNHGDDLRLSTSLSYQVMPKIKLIGQAETKLIMEYDYPHSDPFYLGASHIIGFGGGLKYILKDNFDLDLLGKIFDGKANGGNIKLSGFQIQGGLLIRF